MRVTASFEDGTLSLRLEAENESEQRMVGAVIDQPQGQDGCAYLDKELVSAVLHYEGHWTNKRIKSVKLSVFRPNKAEVARG